MKAYRGEGVGLGLHQYLTSVLDAGKEMVNYTHQLLSQ